MEDNSNHNKPWGRELDFAVHAGVYGKVQAEDNVNLHNQERKGKKKLVLALAGLSSYLCSLCAMCQSVQARGWYPPHHTILGIPAVSNVDRPFAGESNNPSEMGAESGALCRRFLLPSHPH